MSKNQITNKLWESEDERLCQQGLDEKKVNAGLGFVCVCTSYASCSGVANAGIDVPDLLKRQID